MLLPPGHSHLLRHHADGPCAQPLLLGPVHGGRQHALRAQHPAGDGLQSAGGASGHQLRAPLGAAAAAATGRLLLPHAGLLPPHVPRTQAPVQPHAVARLLALLRDVDRPGHHPGQWQLSQVSREMLWIWRVDNMSTKFQKVPPTKADICHAEVAHERFPLNDQPKATLFRNEVFFFLNE